MAGKRQSAASQTGVIRITRYDLRIELQCVAGSAPLLCFEQLLQQLGKGGGHDGVVEICQHLMRDDLGKFEAGRDRHAVSLGRQLGDEERI